MSIHKRKKYSLNSQRAYSLIELMISITIGLIISAAVLTMYVSIVKSDNDNLKSIRLNQDIRAAMGLIVRDLRRAGYNSGAVADVLSGLATKPFQGLNIDTGNSCLNYSYDADKNGLSANESFGFKLDAGAIQSSSNTTDCSANGVWLPLTDQFLVEITAFTLNDVPVTVTIDPGPPVTSITTRQVTISITARLTRDTDVVRTISEIVEVRNVEFLP